ncbi:MAG: DEAD/DEAH box helicase [Elusimicrobia bacterium]|jgi:ATP-dependent RNA helicase RhlE|nr:DEAD/DEAH box helicase [Elusimicrobiota bacterium]
MNYSKNTSSASANKLENFSQFKLDSRLMQGISTAGFEEPTPVQKKVIPMAITGSDLIVTAQTGTGKTAAFVLPILHKLLDRKPGTVSALIVTPTRELAAQIHRDIQELKGGTNVKSITIYGGVSAKPQIRALRSGLDIVIACPGRLLDLMNRGHVKLGKLDTLVLDEADRMLDMGFLPDIKRIIAKTPSHRKTMLFSATFPRQIETLAKKSLTKPQRVSIGMSKPAHTVDHALFPVPQHLKAKLLYRLLKDTNTESVLVFTRTKHRAKSLSAQIAKRGYSATSLHGNRSQRQRDTAIKGFRDGRFHIMVATDIAARGLDIDNISHVINYDIPGTPDDYIHRIGRTGRAKRSGDAFTFITKKDRKMVRKLENIIDSDIKRTTLDDFNYGTKNPYKNRRSGKGKSRKNKWNNKKKTRRGGKYKK